MQCSTKNLLLSIVEQEKPIDCPLRQHCAFICPELRGENRSSKKSLIRVPTPPVNVKCFLSLPIIWGISKPKVVPQTVHCVLSIAQARTCSGGSADHKESVDCAQKCPSPSKQGLLHIKCFSTRCCSLSSLPCTGNLLWLQFLSAARLASDLLFSQQTRGLLCEWL